MGADDLVGTTIPAGELAVPTGPPGTAAGTGMLIGMLADWPGPVIPDGWLPAYGQAVSRQVYSQLFEAYDTEFGAGDGSTTFNLPDTRARVIVGLDVDLGGGYAQRVTAGISGVNSLVLGAVGGSEYLQVHSHGVYDPSHGHTGTDHDHGHYDPGHAHTGGPHDHIRTDHQHGLWDPGHGHGIGDPGHGHAGYANGMQDPGLFYQGAGWTATGAWNLGVTGSGTGIWFGGSGLNSIADWGGYMWNENGNGGSTGGTGWYGAYVGTWSDAQQPGCYGNYASISLYNAGDGGSQNVQPSFIVQKIVYTGVYGLHS